MDGDCFKELLVEFEAQMEIDRGRAVICKGEVDPRDLMNHFTNWVSVKEVECIQRLARAVFKVSFSRRVVAKAILEMGPIIDVRGRDVFIQPFTFKLKKGDKVRTIFVKHLPAGFPRREVAHTLAKFGTIVSIVPEYYREPGFEQIASGTWIVKMLLNEPVPNFLQVGKYEAVCSYSMVTKVCRKCGQEGHFGASCSVKKEQDPKNGSGATAGRSQDQSGSSAQNQKKTSQQNRKEISGKNQKKLSHKNEKELCQGNQKELYHKDQKELCHGKLKELPHEDHKELSLGNPKEPPRKDQKELCQGNKKEFFKQNLMKCSQQNPKEPSRQNDGAVASTSAGATPKTGPRKVTDASLTFSRISTMRQEFISQIDCIRESIRDLEERKKEGKGDLAKLDERINSYHKIEKLLVADYAKNLELVNAEQDM